MVRKSTLVYDLLRNDRRNGGFSPNEIVERVSQDHNILPGKALKKQISVALRRGIDFGILKRENNRYRFDLGISSKSQGGQTSIAASTRRRPRVVKKPRPASAKPRRKRNPPAKKHPQEDRVIPRPRIPHPPPTWAQKKRNLREEPIPKYIRHPSTSSRL
ncbi:uncharacterized protein LOC123268297 [Cotesia glomerata]|uniref:H15 domain-containing protein n=1 Tax=Cotesia glomerata TaxID=32391 RepID=A0AAV7J2B1_COTGL|nr:uncharacterized protein LOC123268297 [Cotesia glomerata]KAH0566656.1 hypothetical protein KQX54_002948 [Cotesia glomerata]